MSFYDRIFNKKKEAEIRELKEDVNALTQFSALQMMSEKEFNLQSSSKIKSTEFDKNVLIELWEHVPEVSTVISKITDRAKTVPWGYFKVKSGSAYSAYQAKMSAFAAGQTDYKSVMLAKDDALVPVEDDQVNALLKNPNRLQDWSEMISQLITYWYVTGDSFLIGLGAYGFTPDELSVMASQQMSVKINESYTDNPFQVGSDEPIINRYEFDNGKGKVIKFTDIDIIAHMKAPNIVYRDNSWVSGYSPLASAILASRTLKHEYLSRLSLVRDRGMMGMIVGDNKQGVMPSAEQTEAVYKRLQKFGLGDGKANPYGATNGSFKWLNMSFNSGELELLKGREENLKVLARKMNVPTDLVIGDSTFNNQATTGKQIYTTNVMPWLDSFAPKLNALLGHERTGNLALPIYDGIQELQQDMKVATDIMTTQYNAGLITKEEGREGLNKEPKTEGEYKNDDKTT